MIPNAMIAAVLSCMTLPVFGQMISDPSNMTRMGRTQVGGSFTMSEISYEAANSDELERKIIGADMSFAITRDVNLMGQVGLSMDSKYDSGTEEGDGYLFGFGGRARLTRIGKGTVTGYGLINFVTDEWKVNGVKVEQEMTDFHLGGIYTYRMSRKFRPYAGLEVIPHSDGSMKAKSGGFSFDEDIEREDSINMKVGANIALGSILFRPEATLMGEKSFLFAGSSTF